MTILALKRNIVGDLSMCGCGCRHVRAGRGKLIWYINPDLSDGVILFLS
jgi:hypothetical protein